MRIRLLTPQVIMATVAICRSTFGGGLFLPAHGVRGLGRAGAFIVGGDDPGAIWYNPATIVRSRQWQLLVDATVNFRRLDYTRVDSGGNRLPEVNNQAFPGLTPTIAVSGHVWGERIWFGGSLSTPTAALPRFPRPRYNDCVTPATPCLDTVTNHAPQRYSMISLSGSFFSRLDLALAYRPFPFLSMAISLQNGFTRLDIVRSVSASTSVLGGPEDPAFDALAEYTSVDLFSPSAKISFWMCIIEKLAIGGYVQFPQHIGGEGKGKAETPRSPFFSNTKVTGDRVNLTFTLPWTFGVGIEGKPIDELAIELDFVWEGWSALQAIRADASQISVENVPSIGSYQAPVLIDWLGFRDSYSVRAGTEWKPGYLPLMIRAGYAYERGAVPNQYFSAFAADPTKHMIAVGLSYQSNSIRLDLAYAAIVAPDVDVDYRQSRALQINPASMGTAVAVGGGRYRQQFHLVGLGINKRF